ncbi:glycosyl transferase [Actinomadura harenae]|uniref:Glycosyl transferase n=2 Tax=Actinomadura harenae TaxID=2483351 RepID=A0A3M2LAS0_9ACTN|nr:glycosyl transferase [Actinomadura harenae]
MLVDETSAARPGGGRARWARRLVLGGADDPRWARPGLWALLAATAVLYVWGLGASGWANAFYAAAAQAGSVSWKAMFFGASDAAGAITVDKTPLALWPMALSARVFGVNAWSLLVPQALMGVGTVASVHAAVRRALAGEVGRDVAAGAGLLAGAVLAVTPVAVLMFRFNNPDALLVLLLSVGVYALVRAQERASTGWLLVAAAAVGSGFLAKMLQAFLVLPVFALVYLVVAPTPLRRRVWQSLAAGGALLVAAGWWVAVVALVPASSRPYIGGSQHNSVLELALGYNGLGRLNGNETGGLGNTDGDAGWLRMFGTQVGGQIAWLVPAALLLLVAGLWAVRRTPRAGAARASLLVWGGWVLVTGVVFSLMRGIFHEYYTVALAPAVAALVGLGAGLVWPRRRVPGWAGVLAGTVAVSAVWACVLLHRTPQWRPWLTAVVVVAALVALVLIASSASEGADRAATAARGEGSGAGGVVEAGDRGGRGGRVVAGGTVVASLVTVFAGPVAYALDTASTPHSGAIVTAGPSTGRGPGGFGGHMRMRGGGGQGAWARGMPNGTPNGMQGGMPGAGGSGGAFPGFAGNGGPGTSGGFGGPPPGGGFPGGRGRGGHGGPGGLLGTAKPSSELVAALRRDASSYTWVAAAVGSNNAAGYQLATGRPVMAVGGFNGTDPAPTLEGFQRLVAAGRVHYFVGGSMPGARGGSSGGSDDARRIAAWVEGGFAARTVGGVTVYDLTTGLAGGR